MSVAIKLRVLTQIRPRRNRNTDREFGGGSTLSNPPKKSLNGKPNEEEVSGPSHSACA
jgi:hypothetical protein